MILRVRSATGMAPDADRAGMAAAGHLRRRACRRSASADAAAPRNIEDRSSGARAEARSSMPSAAMALPRHLHETGRQIRDRGVSVRFAAPLMRVRNAWVFLASRSH
jgi:hypothetical protein